MSPRLIYLHQSFQVFTPPVSEFLAQLEDTHLDTRIGAANNPLHWVLGHTIMARNGAASLLGGGEELAGWDKLYGRGSVPGDAADAIDLATLCLKWEGVSQSLLAALAEAPDALLDKPSPRPPPAGLKTIGQFIGLLTVHDTYHIGQLGHFKKELFGEPLLV